MPESCSKHVRIHLNFIATLSSFSRKRRVLSAYCRLVTLPGIRLEHNPLINPALAPFDQHSRENINNSIEQQRS
jgi:hypothetical protein